jgi:antitoxin component of MazEF toxin-antitoxin module
MANFPRIQVRKNGGSLYLRLPPDFIRANNLKPGDMIMPDLSTFKIIRQEEAEALRWEPAVVEAVPAE